VRPVPVFARRFFDPDQRLSRLGEGSLGGKAEGLLAASAVLAAHGPELARAGMAIDIPAMVILGTGFFDAFVADNRLGELVDEPPGAAFHRAAIPAGMVGDLMALAGQVRVPLAVRSSSSLEDALGQPFAGVYGTKMVPANQLDAEARFRSLVDAIKFVWASTYFARARAYLAASGDPARREKMAVIVQEVVGRRHGERFYPDVSGVARSLSFYALGGARPEEGVVDLAVGLGKTIVDGGRCWSFSPARPRASPPFASARERVQATQSELWAVNVGPPPAYDPMAEAEFLTRVGLAEAEADGTLRDTASTYDPGSDRLWPGLGRQGPRVLDFAPILVHDEWPLVPAVQALLAACEAALDAPVEIEFAVAREPERPPRLGFLQVRPLLVSRDAIAVSDRDLEDDAAVVATRHALGNGRRRLDDAIVVAREGFAGSATPAMALEIERLNGPLVAAGRPYLLVGFGRWGSSDPWLGIPVRWDQIAGARAIVEATLPQMSPEPSQGSHFFHNLSSFGVLYLTVPASAARGVDWSYFDRQATVGRTEHARHVRLVPPLEVVVDGRTQRGVARPLEAS
jgi:hypothetical protein